MFLNYLQVLLEEDLMRTVVSLTSDIYVSKSIWTTLVKVTRGSETLTPVANIVCFGHKYLKIRANVSLPLVKWVTLCKWPTVSL